MKNFVLKLILLPTAHVILPLLLLLLLLLFDVDRLCGLVVRVLGYGSGSPGSIPGTTKKSNVSGTGPLSLVSTTE
jgi:hypothetical protein